MQVASAGERGRAGYGYEVGNCEGHIPAANTGAHEDLVVQQGRLIDHHPEALAQERERADTADLQSCEALSIALAGHAQLLCAEPASEDAKVELLARGHHDEQRPRRGRLVLNDEGLVHEVGRDARFSGDAVGRTNAVIKAEDGVRDLSLVEYADGERRPGHLEMLPHDRPVRKQAANVALDFAIAYDPRNAEAHVKRTGRSLCGGGRGLSAERPGNELPGVVSAPLAFPSRRAISRGAVSRATTTSSGGSTMRAWSARRWTTSCK